MAIDSQIEKIVQAVILELQGQGLAANVGYR